MIAGETLRDLDNNEVLLFPLDCMYITQGEHGSVSHSLAMDFVGWSNQTGQINHYPYYAPCTLRMVSKVQWWPIYESVNPVHLADGSIDYITLCVMHDNNVPYNVGDIVPQGALLGHTGTNGGVGDHVHINVARGLGKQLIVPVVPGQYYELNDSMSVYHAMFVNDTTLYVDYGYPWVTYDGPGPIPPTPTVKKKRKYPWFIQTNRLNRMRQGY